MVQNAVLHIAGLEQKQQLKRFSVLPRTGLAWAIAILILLMLTGGIAIAASNMSKFFDKMLPGISQSGLITELNMSQTIDGVTVVLEQGYADSEKVVIGYRYTTDTCYDSAVFLIASEDEQILQIRRGTGRPIPLTPDHESWESLHVGVYYLDTVDTSAEQLDLRLEIILIVPSNSDIDPGKRREYFFDFSLPINRENILETR
jgi:hypothetical protein